MFPDHLQGLRPITDAESPDLSGRAGVRVGRRRRLEPGVRRLVGVVCEARQAVSGERPGRAGPVAVGTADVPDELPDRRILFRRPMGEFHEAFAFPGRLLAEVSQDRVLHAFAQHPTAQQQGIHFVAVGRCLIHHDPDQPVVPESVDDVNHQTGDIVLLQDVSNLLFRASDGGEVELVRSERQLRHTGELVVGRFGDLDAQLQPVHKVFQREGLLPEPLPLRVFLVHPGAGAIFLGRTRVIERPHTIQERRDRLAALRQLQRQHAGAVDADIRAIHRVVIDEDEALQPEIELVRERHDVLRLAVPIDAPRNQVLALQHHVGPLVEDVQHILLVVLAAQTEQHAGVHAPEHEFLQPAERGAHFDALRTVLAAHPLPQRVVAVQHDHLEWRSLQVVDGADQRRPDRRVALRGVRDVTRLITVRVVVLVDRILLQRRRRADRVHVRYRGGRRPQGLLGLVQRRLEVGVAFRGRGPGADTQHHGRRGLAHERPQRGAEVPDGSL